MIQQNYHDDNTWESRRIGSKNSLTPHFLKTLHLLKAKRVNLQAIFHIK